MRSAENDGECLRLRDVPGVDHALDARGMEQFNDARDIAQVVVRIAHYADSRQRIHRLPAPSTRPLGSNRPAGAPDAAIQS